MLPERHVRLFKNGRNQALRIPREFELPGNEAIVRKEGDRLIIEPVQPRSLLALLSQWEPTKETIAESWICHPNPWISRMGDIRYLLDTNVLSSLIKQPAGPVAAQLARVGEDAICT